MGFALLNVILYFGFRTAILFEYLDTAIYTLLLGQVVFMGVNDRTQAVIVAVRRGIVSL